MLPGFIAWCSPNVAGERAVTADMHSEAEYERLASHSIHLQLQKLCFKYLHRPVSIERVG
jgi:hypothetical protein